MVASGNHAMSNHPHHVKASPFIAHRRLTAVLRRAAHPGRLTWITMAAENTAAHPRLRGSRRPNHGGRSPPFRCRRALPATAMAASAAGGPGASLWARSPPRQPAHKSGTAPFAYSLLPLAG
jgi:hypothetical protein